MNTIYTKEELLTSEVDDDGIIWVETEYPWDHDATEAIDHFDIEGDSGPEPHVAGTPELQAKLRTLIKEYRHIFSEELRPNPALVSPLALQVDQSTWRTLKNGGPARPQTALKEKEIERQIKKMLESKVIKESQAPWYSQVHLTPKPDNTWRFCIDYRKLNDCSEAMGWPIPNVYRMLQRLGARKAKYYGVMDLTSGYYQAPLSLNSQSATAFITFMGTYEWRAHGIERRPVLLPTTNGADGPVWSNISDPRAILRRYHRVWHYRRRISNQPSPGV